MLPEKFPAITEPVSNSEPDDQDANQIIIMKKKTCVHELFEGMAWKI